MPYTSLYCLTFIISHDIVLTQQYPPRFDQIPAVLQFPENTAVSKYNFNNNEKNIRNRHET